MSNEKISVTGPQSVAFDVVLPPSEFEFEDLIKRELVVTIGSEPPEAIDVGKNDALLQGFEADLGTKISLHLIDHGLEDRSELNPLTGRIKLGQVGATKEAGSVETTLSVDSWCPAGHLGVRAALGPPLPLESFQNEAIMRTME